MSSPPQQARPPPPLPDDLIEEILARFPPADPALLVRTALVCKSWCRLLSGAGFRRRFRRHHRTPPLLFYIYHRDSLPRFKPTSSFRPLHAPSPNWHIITARHGRFLVVNDGSEPANQLLISSSKPFVATEFIVWDPITDEQHTVPTPPAKYTTWNATLLCAAVGCDHSDCPWGAFLVVFVFAHASEGIMSACVYSSEHGAWRESVSVHHDGPCVVRVRGSNAIVGNAVYFVFIYHSSPGVVEYDLGKHELSVIGLPRLCYWQNFELMTAEDGGLGLVSGQESKLCLWSRVAGGQGGCAKWAQQRVIELDKVLPVRDPSISPVVLALAVADDLGLVFIWADKELFTIDIRSSRIEKVGDAIVGSGFIPYTNFYTPALGAAFTGEEARTGA